MATHAESLPDRYLTEFSSGLSTARADTTADKGGAGAGFRPHELLEAALATCMNMTLRMIADERGIPLTGAETRVTLDRSVEDEVVFEYSVRLRGGLSEAQRQVLLDDVLARSSVWRTLSKPISFRPSAALSPKAS